ncbi:MAG: ribonuclease [Patescibacteria group bacterium]|nr:ribonuclease [Patescibacteria group bacterium]
MQDFLNKIGIVPNNILLYEQAFVHRSFINENPKFHLGHNERLEFLGDAVLELIVTDFLYNKYPDRPEGDLTSYRSALVNTHALGDVSKGLGFNNYLQLSKGESRDKESRARLSILADTYEAVLGAIYLDLGYLACEDFVVKTLLPYTEDIVKNNLFKDAKSFVQEMAQEKIQITPIYKLLQESGPDHNKIFTVGIYFDDKLIAEGKGNSKQLAEIEAAKNAIIKKGWSN